MEQLHQPDNPDYQGEHDDHYLSRLFFQCFTSILLFLCLPRLFLDVISESLSATYPSLYITHILLR